MRHKKKIFCAIDFSNLEQSKKFISKIEKHVGGLKIGLEFFVKNGPKGVIEIKKIGLPIFLDLKLKDIPNTVKKAFENILELNPDFISVHLTGGSEMLKQLVNIKKKTKILGVSLLTSLDDKDLEGFGLNITSQKYVENLSKIGIAAGIDGLVSSAHEVPNLKKIITNKDFLFVTPGIKFSNEKVNDQKRIVSPGRAVNLGSSILIIGRTITKSKNPVDTLKKISEDIEVHFES